MPIDVQGKFLRALEERKVARLGSNRPRPVDFRLISAMNKEPSDAFVEGILREDLYYRLNTVEMYVPPLRGRREDFH